MGLAVKSDAPESVQPGSAVPARGRSDRTVRIAAVALSLYVLAFWAWVLTGTGTEWTRTVIADTVFLPVNLVGFIFAAAVARQADGHSRFRKAWLAIAIAYAAWWCGDALWFVYEVVLRQSPFPSIADAGYLLFYPTLLVGIVTLAWPAAGRRQRERLALDAGIVVISATVAVWYLVVEPTTRQPMTDWLATVLSVAYPVGDLLLIFGIAAVLLRPVGMKSIVVLRFLIAGATAFVIADVAYARQSLNGTYESGNWTDAVWLTGQVLFVWAAASQLGRRPGTDGQAPARAVGRVGFTLPYAAVVVAYLFVLAVGLDEASSRLEILVLMATCLTAIVLTRQVVTVRENQALVRDMQASEARMRVFLADAAHQLRSPITGIQACAEGLSTPTSDADRAKLFDGLLRESARAGRLVTELLRSARIDAGQGLSLAPSNLVAICREEAERVHIVSPELSVIVTVDPPRTPTVATVDTNVVREIIANLLDNARRHARERIELRVAVGKEAVEIQVEDDGPGIAPANVDRIFERFVTLDGSGGGLGLSIARELARGHGGDVRYDDGSFVVRLATSLEPH